MAHDFKKFPELPNSKMVMYYFESPHTQILSDFRATVVKVHDGDTVTLQWDERDFDFPLRFIGTNAPELNEPGGIESQQWLEKRILNEEVDIIIDPTERVGKWGRLLGIVMLDGINVNEESIIWGMATSFEARHEGQIPDLNKELDNIKI